MIARPGTESESTESESANDWIMGREFTVVDGYALVFYGWGARSGYPMKDLSDYTA